MCSTCSRTKTLEISRPKRYANSVSIFPDNYDAYQVRGKSSASKSPGKRIQTPNTSGLSYRSGEDEFYTPTGTIEISQVMSEADASRDDFERLGTSTDLSIDVMKVLSERRMTVDNATVFGLIQDIEKAQMAAR